jgi:hypothetical protein
MDLKHSEYILSITMETCSDCKQACGLMTDTICADCYWDADSKRKAALRADPNWVFSRAYSFATVVLGQSHAEALTSATAAVKVKFTSQ